MCSIPVSRHWTPLVTIIIPCRNEEKQLVHTINSILKQNYPIGLMQLILVDACSNDRTIPTALAVLRASALKNYTIVNNPDRFTPAALNIGLKLAQGDVIFTFGAHSLYSTNYIARVVTLLNQTNAAAVGSVAVTLPGAKTPMARAVARVLSSPFGVGNSRMRIHRRVSPDKGKPLPADTASAPGYRREVFEQIGGFNPSLIRNQDIEFNLRLRRTGKKILIDPTICTYYFARSRLRDLFRNAFENGYWVIRSLRYASTPFSLRHLVPALFFTTLITSAAIGVFLPPLRSIALSLLLIYFTGVAGFSFITSYPFQENILCLAAFPTLHFGYGLGSFIALISLWRPARKSLPTANPLTISNTGECR